MNYLAHAYLSNRQTHLLVGNFIADHLRGNNFSHLPQNIVEGIQMHRKIDSFTDAHPEFKKAKRWFYNGFEKHSGILVDIYFDHLLAKSFEKYSQTNLDDFSKQVYGVYTQHSLHLPHSSSRFLDYVIKNNIYHAYADISGIERVLFHLSQRIKHQVNLNESVKIFTEHEKKLQENFDTFFNDAINTFIET
jgi:acyl carrier protein phosphodiesterase